MRQAKSDLRGLTQVGEFGERRFDRAEFGKMIEMGKDVSWIQRFSNEGGKITSENLLFKMIITVIIE